MENRTVTRKGYDIPVKLETQPKLWELFVLLMEYRGAQVPNSIRAIRLTGEASGHKRLADRLRDELQPLDLTVTDFALRSKGNMEVTQM